MIKNKFIKLLKYILITILMISMVGINNIPVKAETILDGLTFTKKINTHASPYKGDYTFVPQSIQISFDGKTMTNPNSVLNGGYVDVTYENTYVKSVSVSTGGIVVSNSTSDNGNGTSTTRIFLGSITNTTVADFGVSFLFKDRITPANYVLAPTVGLYGDSGTSQGGTATGTYSNLMDATFVAGNATEWGIKVIYDAPKIAAFVSTNTDTTNQNDGKSFYGGTSTDGIYISMKLQHQMLHFNLD